MSASLDQKSPRWNESGELVKKAVVTVIQNGVVVQQLNQRATRDSDTFRFQLRPEKSGISFYRVRVAAKDELGQFAQPETSHEANLRPLGERDVTRNLPPSTRLTRRAAILLTHH